MSSGSSSVWARLSGRERVLLMVTLVAGLSAFIYAVPYTIQQQRLETLRTRITATEKEIQVLSEKIEKLNLRKEESKQVTPGWELADQKSMILFLEDMSGAARRVGVNLVGIRPTQEIDKQTHKEVSMNLDLKGRYRELGEYFQKLEKLSKLVNIRKVRLDACPDTAAICAAHVEAVTYLAK